MYAEDYAAWGCGIVVALFVGLLIFMGLFVKWEMSEDLVSGIVYNNTNNGPIAGNTRFKIRASVDTYVNEDNTSSYCLPPGSPYIPLVQKAAADKTVKVVVTTKKVFTVKAPWTCIDNVTVTEEKK
jgi:hypothetical protein